MIKGLEKGAIIAAAAASLMLAGCATHGTGSTCGMSKRPAAVKHVCKGAAACKGHHAAATTTARTEQEKV